MMPTMDGTMAARALQQIDPQIEMIAVSGLVGSEQIASDLGTIVKAFLSKPYTAQELLKTLSSIFKHSLSR
jgi:two-component system, cell cycle sensor histidine kinase and response regulator CckA